MAGETRGSRLWPDALLYAASAVFAGLVAVHAEVGPHQDWGRVAAVPYAMTALALAGLAVTGRPTTREGRRAARAAVLVGLLVTAVALPLGLQVAERSGDRRGFHAQSEVLVVEQGAAALADGDNPYAARFTEDTMPKYREATQTHFPYLPGMLVFGASRALLGRVALADARLLFAAATLAAGAAVVVLGRQRLDRTTALLVLVVLPTGALALTTGGDDLPVLGTMLLALVLADRRQPVAAGLAVGAAAAMKQLAWPLLLFLVLAARDPEGRPARLRMFASAAAVIVPFVLPFLAWDPSAFAEDAVRFPLGLGDNGESAAETPSLGHLLVDVWPGLRVPLLVVLITAMVAYTAYRVVVRRPADAGEAASDAGFLLAAAVIFAPQVRFGIAIYAIDLLAWSWLLRRRPPPSVLAGEVRPLGRTSPAGTPV